MDKDMDGSKNNSTRVYESQERRGKMKFLFLLENPFPH